MLEQFHVATNKAKVLNSLVLFFSFLCWISTCVAFGSVLFTATFSESGFDDQSLYFYWNKLHISNKADSSTDNYSSEEYSILLERLFDHVGSKCEHSGQFFLAANVFAFLALTLGTLPAVVCRIASLRAPFVGENARKSISIEFLTTIWVSFWLFLSICVFGAQCFGDFLTYRQPQTSNNPVNPVIAVREFNNVTGTGFGYSIACFLFMIIQIVLLIVIRNDANLHLGPVDEYSQKIGGQYETAREEYATDNSGYQADATNSL